ncbi:MAG: 50S ribosomal protein L3 N(5)-glutamine methyltransferase, partial [Duodenibacillus sp.]
LHEPAIALGSGEDGMNFMREFMPQLADHLTENGVAIVEIGDGRQAFEAIWPDLPVTWLTTSAGDDMCFAVHARDLVGYDFS